MYNARAIFAILGTVLEDSKGSVIIVVKHLKTTRRKIGALETICSSIQSTGNYFAKAGMSSRIRLKYSAVELNIHPPMRKRTAKIVMNFGRKVRVCSWIDVVA